MIGSLSLNPAMQTNCFNPGAFRGLYQDPVLATTWNATNNALNIMNSPMGGIPTGINSMGMPGLYNQGISAYMADPTITALAQNIHDSFSTIPILGRRGSVKAIITKLAQENPQKLAALEITYGQIYGTPDKLRQDIRRNFGGIRGLFGIGKPDCKELQLLNQAAKLNPVNSAIALHEAMHGLGTDEKTVKDIMYNSPDDVLARTNNYYMAISDGKTLQQDIRKDFLRWVEPEDQLLTRLDLALAGATPYYGTY